MAKIIYMDYQATTPMDERVLEAMLPYFKDKFGNAHSATHKYGLEAEEAVQKAREQIANLINADPKEIYFTSGATESNNLILKGTAEFYKQEGKDHIIVSAIEHKCILATAHYLEEKGFKVTYLPVKANGIVDVKDLEAAITPNTIIVSIMAVNNEIGVVEPLKEIGKICKEKGVLFHSDAAQAIGKIEIDVEDMNISAMSISGHKIYGPKGVGALYVRRKPKTKLLPQIHGGAQERGLRSGTLPVPLCVGMGEACRIAKLEMKEDNKRIKELSDYFFNKLNSTLELIYLNGDKEKRIPHNLNISFAGVEGESFMMALSDVVAVSSGSACTSDSLESSYVLKALNIKDDLAHTSIRFGIGRFTTKAEIDTVAEAIIKSITKLRAMSPIWEMIKKGIDIEKIKWAEH